IGSIAWAIVKRPSAHEAAVAIDLELGLQEKFATALYVRHNPDPFAQAAVRDAERAADGISLQRRFPLLFPRPIIGTAMLALIAFALTFATPMDLFGRQAAAQQRIAEAQQAQEAQRVVEDALVKV